MLLQSLRSYPCNWSAWMVSVFCVHLKGKILFECGYDSHKRAGTAAYPFYLFASLCLTHALCVLLTPKQPLYITLLPSQALQRLVKYDATLCALHTQYI